MTISVKDLGSEIRICVMDTGVGIDEKIVKNLYAQKIPVNKIGLYNVHQRVKLIYGNGLVINPLDPGTEVYFDVKKGMS